MWVCGEGHTNRHCLLKMSVFWKLSFVGSIYRIFFWRDGVCEQEHNRMFGTFHGGTYAKWANLGGIERRFDLERGISKSERARAYLRTEIDSLLIILSWQVFFLVYCAPNTASLFKPSATGTCLCFFGVICVSTWWVTKSEYSPNVCLLSGLICISSKRIFVTFWETLIQKSRLCNRCILGINFSTCVFCIPSNCSEEHTVITLLTRRFYYPTVATLAFFFLRV